MVSEIILTHCNWQEYFWMFLRTIKRVATFIFHPLMCVVLQELKDSFNYGLFCPPYNGRAGKFLDDERMLQDYPMPGHVGYLEVRVTANIFWWNRQSKQQTREWNVWNFKLSYECESVHFHQFVRGVNGRSLGLWVLRYVMVFRITMWCSTAASIALWHVRNY